MPTFKVWQHDLDETSDDAVEIVAFDFEYAAERFAKDDVDGAIDGSYESGYTLAVEDEHGERRLVTVTVEYEPTFYATEAPFPEDESDAPAR